MNDEIKKTKTAGVYEIPAGTAVSVHALAARFPMLDQETLDGMKKSITDIGQQIPGTIDQDGVLVEGRMRKLVCDELGLSFKVTKRNFKTEDERERFILAVNKDRRLFNLDQSAALIVDRYHDRYQEEAKEAMLDGAAKGGKAKGGTAPSEPSSKPSKGLKERFHTEFGVSYNRGRTAIKLFKEGNDLLKDVINGKLTLNQALKALAKRNVVAKPKKAKGGNGKNKVGTQITSQLGPDDIETIHGWMEDVRAQLKQEFENIETQAEAWEIVEAFASDELGALQPDGAEEQDGEE